MDMDFSTVLAGLAAATIVSAILAAGVVKVAPKFARWGVNQLTRMFG